MLTVYGLGGLTLITMGLGNSIFNIETRVFRTRKKVEFLDNPINISIVDEEAKFTDTTPVVSTKETTPKVTVR